jgi:hypothetical protein
MPFAILLVLSIILLVILFAYWNFNRGTRRTVNALFASAGGNDKIIVTEAMLEGLPAPVQRYFRYTGVVGKPIVSTVRLKQVGKIRRSPQQPWMPLTANQYYSVNPPGFVWDAALRMAGLPVARAKDQYQHGSGGMFAKMLALRTIFDARGTEMDQGSMMRYLNEMMWFPSAYLGRNITWKAIDDRTAEVTLTDGGKSVSAVLYIDDEGKLIDFVAQRYREDNGSYTLDTWTTPITAYGEFAGLRLPIQGKGVWKLSDGDLEYINVSLVDLQYDVPEAY